MAETLTNRQINIMQTLVSMLESKEPIKITTAELAKRCEITEAAIYKHFPSKRKIYEGLVDFCEENIFPRISSIKKEVSSPETPFNICTLILAFCEKFLNILLTNSPLTFHQLKQPFVGEKMMVRKLKRLLLFQKRKKMKIKNF